MKHLTSGGSSNATFNISILAAAAGVALAVVAQHLAAGMTSILIHTAIYLLLLLTTAYALFALVWQGMTIWSDVEQAPAVYRSTIASGFLFSLVAIAVTDNNTQNSRFILFGIGLCFIGLISLFMILIVGGSEQVTLDTISPPISDNRYAPSPIQPDPQLARTLSGTSSGSQLGIDNGIRNRPVTPPHRPLVDPGSLPPLFQDDPLYRLPQPRQARFFMVAKGNDLPVNSDDACVISKDETCFALCDGASGSRLPRSWAALLGQQWIAKPFQQTNADEFYAWLMEPRERWQQWVQGRWKPQVDQRNELIGDRPVSSEVVRKTLQVGASATFLGLKLVRTGNLWQACAIGDTCLFVFQRDKSENLQMRECYPLSSSAQFGDRPPLINSIDNNIQGLMPYLSFAKGQIRAGDMLLMATDALAQWLLVELEQRQNDWQALFSLRDTRQFAAFIEQQRQHPTYGMVDDDTTMVIIQC